MEEHETNFGAARTLPLHISRFDGALENRDVPRDQPGNDEEQLGGENRQQ